MECKCKEKALGIEHGRNILGLREDINGFDIVTPDILRKRRNYRRTGTAVYDYDRYFYQAALASPSGFKRSTLEFAAVHRIPLIQFQSALFSIATQLIYELDELELTEYERKALVELFSGEQGLFEPPDCRAGVREWIKEFSYHSGKIASDMCISMLDNGSLLFLYRVDAEDSDEELRYIEDGYTLHWSSESRY